MSSARARLPLCYSRLFCEVEDKAQGDEIGKKKGLGMEGEWKMKKKDISMVAKMVPGLKPKQG